MVAKLADTAKESGKNNVAFLSHFILGDLEQCLDVLIQSGRLPEAAFFARTYLPSQISKVLPQWKEQLAKVSEKAGQSLADPNEYKNLFPNFDQTLAAEKALCIERQRKMPANMFTSVPENLTRRPLEEGLDEDLICEAGADEMEKFSKEPSEPDTKKEHSSPPPQRKMVCDLQKEKEAMKPSSVGIEPDDLEAELEKDLGDLQIDDVDVGDVDLDDEDLLGDS